jgi:hypothetical protein
MVGIGSELMNLSSGTAVNREAATSLHKRGWIEAL